MAAEKQSYTLEDVEIRLDGNIVGGAQSLTIALEQENAAQYEGGSKKPREIMPGQMAYSGTVERLHLDSETIGELIDLDEGNNPYFDIVGVTKNKNPERTFRVVDAMFNGFSLELSLTDATIMSQDFDALDFREE